MAMKQLIDRFTLTDVALTSATTATNTRDGFDSSNINDDNNSTYWSTEDNVTTGAIQLDFEDPVEITAVDVSEHIQLGQRVQAFTVEVKRNMEWVEVARATTIGNRRILGFEPVICSSIRINITKSHGPITLETLKVYETQPNQGRILDEDGGWCWFQDERCIVKDDTLYVGTVSSGYKDKSRKGDINVIKHNLDSGKLTAIVSSPLHLRHQFRAQDLVDRLESSTISLHFFQPTQAKSERAFLATLLYHLDQHGKTNWSTMNRDEFYPGVPDKNTQLNEGQEGGTHWLPGEVDVSIRPGWFYHADQDDKVKSPEKLFQIWLESVGRNANLLLNFPIDRRGLVHETDAANAMAMKQLIDRFTLTDVALTSATTATNTRDGFDSSNINDDNNSTYWSTEDNVTTGAIQLDFEDPVEITAVDVSEHIQLGQRVQAFTVEVKRNMEWVEVARATTIGNRRILGFEPVICSSIRINITKSHGPITLETLKVYETQPNQGRILDEDGGWCWFQDERCIVKDDTLYVGTVSSGYKDKSRKGDINVIKHNLDSGKLTAIEIHDQLELDDHDAPALLSTDDGILAVWSTHGGNWKTHYLKIKLNGSMSKHSTFSPHAREGYGVTYSNLFKMNAGTIVNFIPMVFASTANFHPCTIFLHRIGNHRMAIVANFNCITPRDIMFITLKDLRQCFGRWRGRAEFTFDFAQ